MLFLTRTSRPLRTSWLKSRHFFSPFFTYSRAFLQVVRPDGRTTPRISRNDYITASRPECQEYCQKNLEKIVQYGEFFISEAKCANLAPVWAAALHFGKSAHRMKRTVPPAAARPASVRARFVYLSEINRHFAQKQIARFMDLTSRFLLHCVPRFAIIKIETKPEQFRPCKF